MSVFQCDFVLWYYFASVYSCYYCVIVVQTVLCHHAVLVNNQNHTQHLLPSTKYQCLHLRLVLTYMTFMLCVLDTTPVPRIQPYCVCLEFIIPYVDRHFVCIMKLA